MNEFYIENNIRTFADLLSNSTGKEAIAWLCRRYKKQDNLINIRNIEYLYYYDGQDDIPFYNIKTSLSDLPHLKDIMVSIILHSEAVFGKHFEFDELLTVLSPERPFTRIIKFDITPVGKPTWQPSDRWASRKPRDKYLAYKKHLQLLHNQTDFELPDKFKVTYFSPIAKSYSKKRKIALHNQPRKTKPDVSNCQKGLEDILLPDGDETIWDVRMITRYTIGNGDGTGGYILIEYGENNGK